MCSRTPYAIAILSLALVLLALAGCGREDREAARAPEGSPAGEAAVEQAEAPSEGPAEADREGTRPDLSAELPRLVDLGKGTCIPCKMMAPILEELKREYEGSAVVEVIDLRDDPQAAARYAIRVMPTQIFFDSEGKEVWRHEGFLGKEEIIAKFTEMGVRPLDD